MNTNWSSENGKIIKIEDLQDNSSVTIQTNNGEPIEINASWGNSGTNWKGNI